MISISGQKPQVAVIDNGHQSQATHYMSDFKDRPKQRTSNSRPISKRRPVSKRKRMNPHKTMQESSSGILDAVSSEAKPMSGGSFASRVLDKIGHPQLKHLSRVMLDYPNNSNAGLPAKGTTN